MNIAESSEINKFLFSFATALYQLNADVTFWTQHIEETQAFLTTLCLLSYQYTVVSVL